MKKQQKYENENSVAFTTAEKIEKTLNKGESGGGRILQNCRNGKPNETDEAEAYNDKVHEQINRIIKETEPVYVDKAKRQEKEDILWADCPKIERTTIKKWNRIRRSVKDIYQIGLLSKDSFIKILDCLAEILDKLEKEGVSNETKNIQ